MGMVKYSGIGARDTPPNVLSLMELYGASAAQYGWLLRSGHARGADTAFEIGCNRVNGPKEIFTATDNSAAFDVAAKYHPAWDKCDYDVRRLHARNSYIILGKQLDDPVDPRQLGLATDIGLDREDRRARHDGHRGWVRLG